MKHVRVAPLSRQDLTNKTLQLRIIAGILDVYRFPVIEFLEKWMPKIFPEFNYHYGTKAEMGNAEGLMIPETNTIMIRLDVIEAARKDDGRARFTILHEIAHYILHRKQKPIFCRESELVKRYIDPEWQANAFAADLLMPPHLVAGMRTEEVIRKCKVSRQAAEIQIEHLLKN